MAGIAAIYTEQIMGAMKQECVECPPSAFRIVTADTDT